jgi:hypothetical protein
VSGSVGSKQRSVLGDLDGIADEADTDSVTAVAVADPVTGAGEAHRAAGVDLAQHLVALRQQVNAFAVVRAGRGSAGA